MYCVAYGPSDTRATYSYFRPRCYSDLSTRACNTSVTFSKSRPGMQNPKIGSHSLATKFGVAHMDIPGLEPGLVASGVRWSATRTTISYLRYQLYFLKYLYWASPITVFVRWIAQHLMGSISILFTNKAVNRKKISAEPGFEAGAAGWEARMLPLCCAAPLSTNRT